MWHQFACGLDISHRGILLSASCHMLWDYMPWYKTFKLYSQDWVMHSCKAGREQNSHTDGTGQTGHASSALCFLIAVCLRRCSSSCHMSVYNYHTLPLCIALPSLGCWKNACASLQTCYPEQETNNLFIHLEKSLQGLSASKQIRIWRLCPCNSLL